MRNQFGLPIALLLLGLIFLVGCGGDSDWPPQPPEEEIEELRRWFDEPGEPRDVTEAEIVRLCEYIVSQDWPNPITLTEADEEALEETWVEPPEELDAAGQLMIEYAFYSFGDTQLLQHEYEWAAKATNDFYRWLEKKTDKPRGFYWNGDAVAPAPEPLTEAEEEALDDFVMAALFARATQVMVRVCQAY